MKYTFLLVSLALFLIPFCLLIDRRTFVFKQIVSAVIPSFIVTVFFTEMAVFWAGLKIMIFNKAYLLGPYYRYLPVEFYLFTFAFSLAGLAIYSFLNAKFPNNSLQRYSLAVSNMLLGICIAFIFFAYSKWYTVVIFGSLFILLLFIEYKNVLRFMYRFYRAFIVCLLLFYACYGWLYHLPVITHDHKESVGFEVLNVPLETPFLMMASLLLGVFLLEAINSRRVK